MGSEGQRSRLWLLANAFSQRMTMSCMPHWWAMEKILNAVSRLMSDGRARADKRIWDHEVNQECNDVMIKIVKFARKIRSSHTRTAVIDEPQHLHPVLVFPVHLLAGIKSTREAHDCMCEGCCVVSKDTRGPHGAHLADD